MTAPSLPRHDAVVLAGGQGRRLGGKDKATLVVGGRTLLERALDAAAGAGRVVVVGPGPVPEGVGRTLEDPPGGGPVAGAAAGVAWLAGEGHPPAGWTLLLAVDQPAAAAAVPSLLGAAAGAGPEVDAVCHADPDGHRQWLLALYRTARLSERLAGTGTSAGRSVRGLVAPLRFREVAAGREHVGDVDTPADLRRWQARLTGSRSALPPPRALRWKRGRPTHAHED